MIETAIQDPEVKMVKNTAIVNELLRRGFKIVQVKADKLNRDKTVFVFEWSNEFQEATNQLMNSK